MGRQITGVIFTLLGFIGLAASVAGLMIGRHVISDVDNGFEQIFVLAADNLDTVYETLVLTDSMVQQIAESLETISLTAESLAIGINRAQPMLDQVKTVTVEEVPLSLETIQSTIPDVSEAARAIDDTLTILDIFEIDTRVFGIPIRFDLGIDYDPSNPLEDSVERLGQSLNGLPETLRAMESDIKNANTNLELVGENLDSVTTDLEAVNETITEVSPLLKDNMKLTIESGDQIRQLKSSINRELGNARLFMTLSFIWLGFSQIVPLYLGSLLLRKGDAKGP